MSKGFVAAFATRRAARRAPRRRRRGALAAERRGLRRRGRSLQRTFPSTGGGGVVIGEYDPVIEGDRCRTAFTATMPDGQVFRNIVEFRAVPAQGGGTLCTDGRWRASDGGASAPRPSACSSARTACAAGLPDDATGAQFRSGRPVSSMCSTRARVASVLSSAMKPFTLQRPHLLLAWCRRCGRRARRR